MCACLYGFFPSFLWVSAWSYLVCGGWGTGTRHTHGYSRTPVFPLRLSAIQHNTRPQCKCNTWRGSALWDKLILGLGRSTISRYVSFDRPTNSASTPSFLFLPHLLPSATSFFLFFLNENSYPHLPIRSSFNLPDHLTFERHIRSPPLFRPEGQRHSLLALFPSTPRIPFPRDDLSAA